MHNLDIMLVFKIVLPYYVDMYVARASWPSSNGKSYQSIHLRESYRDGEHVRKRDIANLTHCDPKEIAAIELALQFKGNLAALGSIDKVQLSQGLSLGAVWTVAETARRLGIDQALGTGFAAQLALWQVLARVLEQGSRLSAVRLAQVHAACDVLGIQRGFDENDLYANLTWLSAHQEAIEKLHELPGLSDTGKLLFSRATLKVYDRPTLRAVVQAIQDLDLAAHDGHDFKGDMYEYLLSKLSAW